VIVVSLVGLHLCVTVFLARTLNLWIDEAYSLQTTGNGVAHALRQAIHFELQPPAFYVLLSVWRKVDPGLFFSRLFSVVCVAMAIPVAAMAWTRYQPRIHPGWIAAALAFSPAAVWAAVEARPYALSLLLATALLAVFAEGFLSDSPRPGRRATYAALGILALYTQYYLGFLLAGGAAALVILGRWRALRDYSGWMLLVGGAFVPLLLTVPGQVASHTDTVQPSSLSEALNSTLARLEDLLLSTASLAGGRAGRWLYRGALAAVILVAHRDLLAGRWKMQPPVVALLVISLVLLGSAFGVQLLLGTQVVAQRHMLFALPALLLLLYAAAAAGGSSRPVALATLLLLSSAGWALHVRYEPLAKHGDHARVAEYLVAAEAEGEPIFVFPGEQALALEHYYGGRNEIVALPAPASLTRYDPRDFAWRDRDHVVRMLHRRVAASETGWLITYGIEQCLDVPFRSELLEAVVESDFEILERRPFHADALLRHLRRRGDPEERGLRISPPAGRGAREAP
jgi:mannosyltransferase